MRAVLFNAALFNAPEVDQCDRTSGAAAHRHAKRKIMPLCKNRQGNRLPMQSPMNQPPDACERCFVDGFVHRGVRVDGGDDVFDCGFDGARHAELADEFGRF